MTNTIPRELLVAMARKFRLLGEASRLSIIFTLMDSGEKNVGQVVNETGLSQINVSRHLKQLAKYRVVSRRKQGAHVFYHLTDSMTAEICRMLYDNERKHRPERYESETNGTT